MTSPHQSCVSTFSVSSSLIIGFLFALSILLDSLPPSSASFPNHQSVIILSNSSANSRVNSVRQPANDSLKKNYRYFSLSQNSKTVRHTVRGYKEQCSSEVSSTFVPSTGQTLLPETGNHTQCALIYVCFHGTCRCPPGHAHATNYNSTLGLVHQCKKFSEFSCQTDGQCQDIDPNVVCHNGSRQCRCRLGFAIETETGYCKKSYEKYKVQSLINVFKKKERNTASTAPVPTQSSQFFTNNAECKGNSHCTGEYTYCHRGRCKCWPEFQFVLGRQLLTLPNSGDLLNGTSGDTMSFSNNSTTTSATTINEQFDQIDQAMNETVFLENDENFFAQGYCIRKLCQLDSQCQTEDNPNLVCNKTICECRYGFIMYKETKVCIKYAVRRQSCDLTCRIIGGLFASIFMLTLIYWCFYCCYSIIKNYRNHRLSSRCSRGGRRGDPNSYLRNMYDFEPIDYERYLSATTLSRNAALRSGQSTSRFPVNLSTFLRLPLNDDPPSYNQATADEYLPDYDAVMELQELRKEENNAKPE